jgi:hypothetical protein
MWQISCDKMKMMLMMMMTSMMGGVVHQLLHIVQYIPPTPISCWN